MAAGLGDTNQDVIFKKIAPWLLTSKKMAGLKKVSDIELHDWTAHHSLWNGILNAGDEVNTIKTNI